jgi:hypothetical protein
MPDGYEVVAGDLEAHSAAVDGFGKDVFEAFDAGMNTLNPYTYGPFSLYAAQSIMALEAAGLYVLGQCAETLSETAKMLTDTARVYSETEENNESAFSKGQR